ncbi:cupin domain-containing protein [Halosimplex amylolyticum]|uniref:cupin domain-containing protein n=1 Tax=Halosimplex amylolyticum TaxID=3396616 RepID=UPI003F560A24
MEELTVVSQAGLDEPEGSSDVSRQVVFDSGDVLLVQSRVAGGVTTGWHHNGDRHVYGYVARGHAVLEYGPGGNESVALDAGDFIYVPPRTIRRVVNPTDEDWEIVINFVGSGPPAVSVDEPESTDR